MEDDEAIGDNDGYCVNKNPIPVPGGKRKGRGQSKHWTRNADMTRTAAQMARRKAEESERPGELINSVREADPKNYRQAIKSEQMGKRPIAMSEELQALEDNGVWLVVVPPNNSHVLHTKWVYKTKTDADGAIERFKARLVACGNEQVYGVDYGLMFAAVMELSTVKVILVLALRWGVPVRHEDIPKRVREG